jgi:probable phosphoglycerate mutase
MIAEKIDEFLAGHGYRHEKRRFLCRGGTDKTVALFSHGGSGACVLAHGRGGEDCGKIPDISIL